MEIFVHYVYAPEKLEHKHDPIKMVCVLELD